ncbi:MAG: agmatine/peptidylarginine deiminase [Hyphomicrobium sp.]
MGPVWGSLQEAFGARRIIWIDEGLKNDHTDGHIDNIARFVAPGKIVCQVASSSDDPNEKVLQSIITCLSNAADANGHKLEIIKIPSVGPFKNKQGEFSAASHVNFVIANNVVIVPIYENVTSKRALGILQDVFPHRKVVGIPSIGLLGSGNAGGGSFHCITQQQPLMDA